MNYKFPDKFLWGAAASGPQTEGIENKPNLNVWDVWCYEEPDRFYNNLTCHIACDTYNRYREDVQLMKQVGMNSFRTSIQWTRLIEDLEASTISENGLKFYNDYINEMIENGIKPIINLYHFDMPNELMEKYNGFESKHVVELFVKYAKICFEQFGDRVELFTIFNEPIVPIEFGYFYDAHKPCVVDAKRGIQAAYNSALAQAQAIEAYKALGLKGEVGTILNITPIYTRSEHPADLKAGEICDLIYNRSFMDCSVLGKFPEQLIELLKDEDLLPQYSAKELAVIEKNTVDFVGLNYYTPKRVCAPRYAANPEAPWMPTKYYDNYQMPGSRNNPHRDNNEIYPRAVYDIAIDVMKNYGNIKWYLAEIGISITNEESLPLDDGMINDSFRTDLLKEHLVMLHQAIEEGSNCFGVHQWTFIDNWSWLNSHKRRYGLYYLDLETRDRSIKKHGMWFNQLTKNNGF